MSPTTSEALNCHFSKSAAVQNVVILLWFGFLSSFILFYDNFVYLFFWNEYKAYDTVSYICLSAMKIWQLRLPHNWKARCSYILSFHNMVGIILWAGHVARMGEERKVYKVLVGKPEGKRSLGRQGVGGKMGSEWILGRLGWGCGLDSTGSGPRPVAGCC
jgi:hypothetical protein